MRRRAELWILDQMFEVHLVYEHRNLDVFAVTHRVVEAGTLPCATKV